MAKKKELLSTLTISKSPAYQGLTIMLGIDKEREDKFNLGEKIEITIEELNIIGEHRWLIKE